MGVGGHGPLALPHWYAPVVCLEILFCLLMNVWNEKEVKKPFKRLSFCKASIKKPYAKRLNNIDMLHELPFYDELNIVKVSKAFKGYARSYSVEVIDSKDPSVQLTISRPNIKDLLKDLLNETKGFKYQITLKLLLS